MTFVAIEFENRSNNTHTLGYLRIPTAFNPRWHLGFREYLINKYQAQDIKIYPLNVHVNSDNMGISISKYSNMEDDFNLALRSNHYYPICPETDNIRRQWSKLDPMSPDYCVKER